MTSQRLGCHYQPQRDADKVWMWLRAGKQGWIDYYTEFKWTVTSPVTEETLKSTTLIPNLLIKSLIDDAFEAVMLDATIRYTGGQLGADTYGQPHAWQQDAGQATLTTGAGPGVPYHGYAHRSETAPARGVQEDGYDPTADTEQSTQAAAKRTPLATTGVDHPMADVRAADVGGRSKGNIKYGDGEVPPAHKPLASESNHLQSSEQVTHETLHLHLPPDPPLHPAPYTLHLKP